MNGTNRAFRRALSRFVVMAFVIGLGGCAWMGETPPDAVTYPVGKVEISRNLELPKGEWPAENWWQVYGDAQLDTLMNRALRDAPTLAVAEARVKSGQAVVDAVDASRGASIGITALVNRERISGDGFLGLYAHHNPMIGATGPWYTEGIAGLTGSYTVDLWGKERAQLNAAMGRRRALEAETAEVKLLLSVRIATSYFEMQATRAQLDLLNEVQHIRHESLQAHSARFRRGLEPQVLVEKAKAQQAETAQQIEAAQARISVLTEILRSLTGSGPADFPPVAPAPLPADATGVPNELGIELLARRPDLQALRSYVEASVGQVEAAKAAFYPSFNLRAFFGYDAIHLEDLTRASSRQFNLLPGLHLPIFDSGRLNANLSISKTQKNVLVAQYNQAIVDAIRQVAQSGVELESANRQITLQEQRVDGAEISSAGAAAYTATGLSDGTSAAEAQLPLLTEKSRLLDLCLSRVRAQILLTAALGGGYESRSR